jgi:hypothetical protein
VLQRIIGVCIIERLLGTSSDTAGILAPMGDFWVSPEEKAAGALAPEKLAAVVRKYEEDGLCVLCNVIEHDVLDR